MSTPKKLLSSFNKYSGRTVLHPMAMGICLVSEEISAEAAKQGLQTRFIYPNQGSTDDYSADRLNVHIEQKKNGTFCIKRFDLG